MVSGLVNVGYGQVRTPRTPLGPPPNPIPPTSTSGTLSELAERWEKVRGQLGAALGHEDDRQAVALAEQLLDLERQIAGVLARGEAETQLAHGPLRSTGYAAVAGREHEHEQRPRRRRTTWQELARCGLTSLPAAWSWRVRTAEVELDGAAEAGLTADQLGLAGSGRTLSAGGAVAGPGQMSGTPSPSRASWKVDSRLFTGDSPRIIAGRLSTANACLDAALAGQAQTLLAEGLETARRRLGAVHPVCMAYQRGLGSDAR
ncbi:MAG: hypothetical protein U0935_03460 [Pirellulales bacterium]